MQVGTREAGTVAAVAALAGGASLLASKRLQARRSAAAAMLVQHPIEQARRRPRTLGTLAALVAGGLLLSQQLRKTRAGSTTSVNESIELDVPVSTAYNQWTQFEQFPQFMASVQEVRQVDDTHLHWRAEVAGKIKEWDAEITEQLPDQRIAWRSTGGVRNSGVVTFHRISDRRTRLMLQMDYEPETTGEKIGDALGGVKLTAKGNLQRFKELIEQRGTETGAWRGTVTH